MKKSSNEYANIGTLAFVPQIAERVKVPVIVAGGIVDGKGMMAALSLGAEGVLIGTRFVATKESMAPECYKKKILEESSDNTTVTDVFTGMYARVLRNTFTETYKSSETPVLPPGSQYLVTIDVVKASGEQQNSEFYNFYAGQGIDNIHQILSAENVILQIVEEAQTTIQSFTK